MHERNEAKILDSIDTERKLPSFLEPVQRYVHARTHTHTGCFLVPVVLKERPSGYASNVAPPPPEESPAVAEVVPEPEPAERPAPKPVIPLPAFASLAHAIHRVMERDVQGGCVSFPESHFVWDSGSGIKHKKCPPNGWTPRR